MRARGRPLTSNGRPRVVTYHRVSTRDQDPTLAKLHLRGFAQARAFEVVAEIEETGSGARGDRPGLAQVVELARKGEIAYVLVWKLDRLGRSTIDVLGTVEELERCGVTLIATSQGLEVGPGDSAIGRMVLRVLAAVAELERDMISERTLLGLEAARRRGTKLGRPRKFGTA